LALVRLVPALMIGSEAESNRAGLRRGRGGTGGCPRHWLKRFATRLGLSSRLPRRDAALSWRGRDTPRLGPNRS